MTPNYKKEFAAYKRSRIGKRAIEFDIENPKIWELFLRFAREIARSGRDKYSVNMIFERIRWHTIVETKENNFKISNDFRAYYARKIMAEHPEFRGFFTLRTTRQ